MTWKVWVVSHVTFYLFVLLFDVLFLSGPHWLECLGFVIVLDLYSASVNAAAWLFGGGPAESPPSIKQVKEPGEQG